MSATDTTDTESSIGERIKAARLEMPYENGRWISQATFADKLGVHWVTVSNWERGKSPPTVRNIQAIATVTGKPLDFFLAEEAGEPSPFPAAAA